MSMNHTPEPWQMLGMSIVDSEGKGIVGTNAIARELANKTRAVACVNACAGINPEAVPDVVAALREMLNGYERLLAQSVLDVNPGANRYSIAARAALAKLEDVGGRGMTQLDRQVADLKEMSATLASIGTTIDNLRDERDRLNYKLHSKNKIIAHLRIEFNRIHAENARMQSEIQRLTLQLESALHPK